MPTIRTPYVPWSEGIQPNWTVQQAREALTGHELGQFLASSLMIDAMGRDDRITAVLATRISGLLGLPRVVSPGGDSDADQELADAVSDRIDTWAPNDTLAELLHWYHMSGFALAQVIWDFEDKEWVPRLQVWNPQWIWWNESQRVYYATTRQGMIQLDLESGQWLMLTKGQRPWMAGAVRSLTIPWLSRQFAWRDFNRYNERHGLPIVKGMVPASSEAEDKDTFFKNLRTLASSTTVTLPQNVDGGGANYDLELLEAKDGSYETFPRMFDIANTAIAVRLLGQNLSTEVKGGSFAAAKVQERVRMDLTAADEAELSQFFDLLIALWAKFNNTGGAALPVARWTTEAPDDALTTADTLLRIGEAITVLRDAGLSLTEESSAELFGGIGVQVEHHASVSKTPDAEEGFRVRAPGADTGQGDDESGDTVKADARARVRLATGDDPDDDRGFVNGQLFMDSVGDDALNAMEEPLARQLRQITRAPRGAHTYAEAHRDIVDAYAEPSEDESRIEEILAALAALGLLIGRASTDRTATFTDVPSRIAQADQAIDILAGRTGISADDLTEVFVSSDRMGRIRAQTIRAQVAQAASESLRAAATAGDDIADAIEALQSALDPTYGANGSRADVVVRVEAQQVYNAGRWEGLAGKAGAPFSSSTPSWMTGRR